MRKIGELKGKPIIEGNPNEVKNNQIHAKTEGGGGITLSERKNGNLETISGGSSSGGGGKVEYYKLNYNSDKIEFAEGLYNMTSLIKGYKHQNTKDTLMIAPYIQFTGSESYLTNTIAYSFEKMYVSGITNEPKDLKGLIFAIFATGISIPEGVTEDTVFEVTVGDALIPITEEEFYNLD